VQPSRHRPGALVELVAIALMAIGLSAATVTILLVDEPAFRGAVGSPAARAPVAPESLDTLDRGAPSSRPSAALDATSDQGCRPAPPLE
jgi:hypothetical protein